MSPTQTCFTLIKKVNITSTTGAPITAREFELISVEGLNVAAAKNGGTAIQSSDETADTAASKAIDSNAVSYSSTNALNGANLQITFNSTYSLNQLRIKNRYCSDIIEGAYDICKDFLSLAKVEYIDAFNNVKVTTNLGDMSTYTDYTQSLTSNGGCPT
jgi:hypothetical protein